MKLVGALVVLVVTAAGASALVIAAMVHLPLSGAAGAGVGIAVAALACLALPLWLDARLTRAARRQDAGARRMPGRVLAGMNLLWLVGLGIADRARAHDYVSVIRKLTSRAKPRPAEALPPGFVEALRGLSITAAEAPAKPLAYAVPPCPLRYGFVTEMITRDMAANGRTEPIGEGLGIQGTFSAVPAAGGRLLLRDLDVRVRRLREGEAAVPLDLPGTAHGEVPLAVEGQRVRALEGAASLWEHTQGVFPLSRFYPPLPGAKSADADVLPPAHLDRWLRVGGELAAMFTIRDSVDGALPEGDDTPSLSTTGELVAHYVVLANGWPLYAELKVSPRVTMGAKSIEMQQQQQMTARLHLIGACTGPTLPDPRRAATPAEAAIGQYELFLATLMAGHLKEATEFFTPEVIRAHGAARLKNVLLQHIERQGPNALGIVAMDPETPVQPAGVALRLVGQLDQGPPYPDVRLEERDGRWRIAMICVNRARHREIGSGCDLLDVRGGRLFLAPAPAPSPDR